MYTEEEDLLDEETARELRRIALEYHEEMNRIERMSDLDIDSPLSFERMFVSEAYAFISGTVDAIFSAGVSSFTFIAILVLGAPWFAPSTCCIVFAAMQDLTESSEYETACDGLTQDIPMYLYVAGGVQGGLVAVLIFGKCAFVSHLKGCSFFFQCFFLAWAWYGCWIWDTQMNSECQSTDLAKMMLAWSVLQYILLVVGPCWLCCMVPCLLFKVATEEERRTVAVMNEWEPPSPV